MNLIFLIVGIIIGYFLNKDKVKEVGGALKARLIKPDSQVIDSKEENSLNKITDDSNSHHNDFYDETEIR